MHRLAIVILIVVLCGCSTDQSTRFVTEQEARLISSARSAAAAEGFSLKDAYYQVRRYGDGWIVQVDKAPGYTGVGEPLGVIDATYFVLLGADEQVREIHSRGGRWIKSSTQPDGAAPPAH